MAILKHTSSKNASYGDALEYLKYKHHEDSKTGLYEPILDEYGLLQERENYAICSLNGYGHEQDPELWAGSCMETNIRYGKNNTKGERKQHIYVISHPESDTSLLTKEALLEEGKAFVRENLPGYDALIAVHMDTDNPHIHVAINSVRAVERCERPWMMHDDAGNVLRSEVSAGGKHQDNPNFRHHCQDWLLEYTRSHGLTMEDNNKIEAERKNTRRHERYEDLYRKVMSAAMSSNSVPELRDKLKRDYDIDLICRGNTYSLHCPDHKRNIRLDTVGMDKELLYSLLGNGCRGKEKFLKEETIQIEKKKYVQWIRQRRLKNNARAEDTIADAAAIIADKIGPHYNKWDFRELNDLLKQTTYLERDLQTELDKIDRLLDRWSLYLDPTTPRPEQDKHSAYVEWCGCDPDSITEYQGLQLEREAIVLQIKEAVTVREALVDCSDQWQERNDENRFQYKYDWTISKEDRLKHQLKDIKANRKKLGQIAYNCQKAADRRIYKGEYLKKAEHFRELWHQKLMEERELKAQLRDIRHERKDLQRTHRARELER